MSLYGGGSVFSGIEFTAFASTPTVATSGSLFGNAPSPIYWCPNQATSRTVYLNASGADATCVGSAGYGEPYAVTDYNTDDAALTGGSYASYASHAKPTYGEPFEFPVTGGSISFSYADGDVNGLGVIPGSTAHYRLKLSRSSYCKIANGSITNWNDPAIYADNGNVYPVDTTVAPADGTSFTAGAAGQTVPIKKFWFRSEGNATNVSFQNHLNTVCGTDWAHGTSKLWLGPRTANFGGAGGNDGVVAAIQGAHYTIGYVEENELPYAGTPLVKSARLANSSGYYASPSNPSDVANGLADISFAGAGSVIAGGSDNNQGGSVADLGSSRKDCVFFVPVTTFANPSNATAYPIVTISYMQFYGKGYVSPGRGGADHSGAIVDFVTYLAGKSGSGGTDARPAPITGIAYLDSSLMTEIYNALVGNAVSSSNFRDVSGSAVSRSAPCVSTTT